MVQPLLSLFTPPHSTPACPLHPTLAFLEHAVLFLPHPGVFVNTILSADMLFPEPHI